MFAGLAVALLLLGLFIRRYIRQSAGSGLAPGALTAVDAGPRGRLVGLSETIRDALAARFGNSLRAKTTEELSTDERLIELIGPDGFRDLMQFFDRIDRIKFAPERPGEPQDELEQALATWGPLMSDLTGRIRARSRGRTASGRASSAS